MSEKINILIGNDSSERRFEDFYTSSVFLMKKHLLEKANKAQLSLETERFRIRFMPRFTIDRIYGIHCNWAYGFDPNSTLVMEFGTSGELKMLKPLVGNVTELFEQIATIEEGGGADGH